MHATIAQACVPKDIDITLKDKEAKILLAALVFLAGHLKEANKFKERFSNPTINEIKELALKIEKEL